MEGLPPHPPDAVWRAKQACNAVVRKRAYRIGAAREGDSGHGAKDTDMTVTPHTNAPVAPVGALTPDQAQLLVHELRSPLTAIVGYAELLKHGKLEGAEQERALEAIQDAVRRMDALLDAATSGERLTRHDSGKRHPVHLREIADRAAADAHAAHWREVFVQCTGDPVVLGDRFLLRRVLDNLISNAIRYSSGAVRIKVRSDEKRALVEIVDHGPGVPVEERDCIFEHFYRIERDKPRPGMGLGLAVTRDIIESYDGSVWVEDTPGGGATFVIALPLEAKSA